MSRAPLFAVTSFLAVLLAASSPGWALPTFGNTCADCHTPTTGRMSVENFQSITDPGPGALKTYLVTPGSSVRLTAHLINGAMQYGVQLKDLGTDGVLNPLNQIAYTPDPDWTPWGAPPYYVISTGPTPWGGSPIDWDFDLGVPIDTPPDFYRFQLTASGSDGFLWTQNEQFYVQVLPEPALAGTALAFVSVLSLRRVRVALRI